MPLVWGWLYRGIANQFKPMLLEALNDEEVQAQIIGFSDALYNRYMAKISQGLGDGIKAVQTQNNPDNLSNVVPFVPTKYKKLLSNPIIQLLIRSLSGKQEQQGQLP